MKFIFLSICLILSLNSKLASQDFSTEYKKTIYYSRNKIDSSLFYAKRLLNIAKSVDQKRKAHDAIAYLSNHIGQLDRAMYHYSKAAQISTKKLNKYKYILNKGIVLEQIGSKIEADSIANVCIDSLRSLSKSYLSYAYDLKANILLSRLDKRSIDYFRQSITLKNDKEKAFVYHQIASAYSTFKKLDSAIFYQKKAVQFFPLKTPNHTVENLATLAKYLILDKRLKEAYKVLILADKQKDLGYLSEAKLALSWGLYYYFDGNKAKAKDIFGKMKRLIIVSESLTNTIADKRNRHVKAVRMYTQLIDLGISKDLYTIERQKSESFLNGLNTAQSKGLIEEVVLPNTHTHKREYIYILLALLAIAYTIKKTRNNKQVEHNTKVSSIDLMVKNIEVKTGLKIEGKNKEALILVEQGKDLKEVAKTVGIAYGTLRKRFWRIARKGGKSSIEDFFK